MSSDRVALLERAEALEWPFVSYAGSAHLAGERSWRGALPTVAPGYLAGISRQLDDHEAQMRRRDSSRDRETAEAVERARPYDADEPAAREAHQMVEDATRAAEYASSTEGKLDRLIAINERIAAALEARK